MDGLWVVCGTCGVVVADMELHEQWHADTTRNEN